MIATGGDAPSSRSVHVAFYRNLGGFKKARLHFVPAGDPGETPIRRPLSVDTSRRRVYLP